MHHGIGFVHYRLSDDIAELAWRSDSVMDCHAAVRGTITGGNGVKKRASRPSQGTVNGVPSLNDLLVDGTLNTTNQPIRLYNHRKNMKSP